jgi:methyltransferase
VFFGGLTGIEDLVEELEADENLKASETRNLFNEYVNAVPEIGSRSLRTEESLLMTMGALMPKFRAVGKHVGINKSKMKTKEKY